MSRRNFIIVLLAAATFVAAARTASGQRMEHEFTKEELFQVYRRLMPEPEARALAVESVSTSKVGEVRGSASGLPYRTIEHVDLTFDTLVMLSLLSDEAKAKAERYLAAMHGGRLPPAEQAKWEQRRAEIKRWADAGYPTSG